MKSRVPPGKTIRVTDDNAGGPEATIRRYLRTSMRAILVNQRVPGMGASGGREIGMPTIAVNGTTLYYELRGDGPPVLFISGASGDAGHWTKVVDVLAGEYTVLTYDRRANSRSPRPENWTAAPIDEQGDDAAALLRALDLAPAVAFGHSSGAIYLTSVALRHPDVLRGAIFYEPPYIAVTSTPEEVRARRRQLVDEGMAEGGPPAAMERFLRGVIPEDTFESLDPEFRDRLFGNGEVLCGLEMAAQAAYLPTPEQLANVTLPCVVAAGADNRDPAAPHHWFYEASEWLADSLRAPLVETAGAHVPWATHPQALAETLRPILCKLAVYERIDAQAMRSAT